MSAVHTLRVESRVYCLLAIATVRNSERKLPAGHPGTVITQCINHLHVAVRLLLPSRLFFYFDSNPLSSNSLKLL